MKGAGVLRKALILLTDLGLVGYWVMVASGARRVGAGPGDVLTAWHMAFLPLDALAVLAGVVWLLLPRAHRLHDPMLILTLALTHASGLMEVVFFLQWGSWEASLWLSNLWLMLMPVGVGLVALVRGRPGEKAPAA